MARALAKIGALLCVICLTAGCEVTLSVFLQKDWNTDPHVFKDHDMTSKAELKATSLFGADAKKGAR